MGTKTWDPSLGTLMIGGTLASEKSWNKISVARVEEGWTFQTGTSGETTRVKNLNKRSQITITVPQASDMNDIMSQKFITGDLLSCGFIDRSGRSIVSMPEGTIVKPADMEFDKEAGEREWMIEGDADIFVGGN